jgi:DNA-binding NtrC family response regulator
MSKILIVDDDEQICAVFGQFLTWEGHTTAFASNAEDAFQCVNTMHPDLVLMDVRMPGEDGITALQKIRKQNPNLHVIIMTAYGSSQTSIEAMRYGAFDYLTKPLDLEVLKEIIDRSLAAKAQSDKVGAPEIDPESLIDLVGDSAPMQAAYKLIGMLASNDMTALVTGERGVGKQTAARTIHENSDRKDREFGVLHCGDFPDEAIGAELFGQEFASSDMGNKPKIGKLESCDGGTLFLDDVELLPLPTQARLLQYLRHGAVERIGGAKAIKCDTRVIAASEGDLRHCVEAGQFNDDLFHDLSIMRIPLPSLRERREDIPALVLHFINQFSGDQTQHIKGIDQEVAAKFQAYDWPGNVTELKRVIQRSIGLARADVITAPDLGDSLTDKPLASRGETVSALEQAVRREIRERLSASPAGLPASHYHETLELVETAIVDEALDMTSGNQQRAAQMLGITRVTLRKKRGV